MKSLVSDGKAKNYCIRKLAKSAINYIYSDMVIALPQLTTESFPTSGIALPQLTDGLPLKGF